jgi:hypothetical protein
MATTPKGDKPADVKKPAGGSKTATAKPGTSTAKGSKGSGKR